MFNYEQNASLSHIHQQKRIDEGERSRLAAEAKPRTNRYGAIFAYALRKCEALGDGFKEHVRRVETSSTSTQEVLVVR